MAETTQGNPSPQDGQGGDAPQYVTVEQLNSAITGRFGEFSKKQEKFFAEQQAGLLGRFEELFKAHQPKQEPQQKPDDAKANPEVAALKAQLQEMQSSIEKEKQRAAEAEKRQREDKAITDLRTHLNGLGLKPAMVEMLSKAFFYADKRVEFDESGRPLLKVRVSQGKGMPEEDSLMTIEDGVKAWAKSKEAADFLPPPGGAAGNSQPVQRGSAPVPQQPFAPLANQPMPNAQLTDAEKAQRANAELARLGLAGAL